MEMNRRDFLRGMGAAGTGMMVFNQTSGLFAQNANPAATPANSNINVALIGAGTQGRILAECIRKIPGVNFKAICDIWEYNRNYTAKRIKAYTKKSVNAYIDYKEMLEKETDLDAVVIATPDCYHAEHTIACLKAGKHVYCEKEMSHKLELAAEMVKTANETGKVRTATLTLSTGSSITITQLDGKDFTGTWTVKSRLFNPNAALPGKPKGTSNTDASSVTIAPVSEPETLDGHVNAFELTGMYNAATMKVAFDIDYEAKTLKMGLFFDKRSTQLAKDGVYCAFVPELEGKRWGDYNFAPSTFGADDCNYEWMWCISEDFNTFRYTPHTQYIARGASNLMLIGISVQVSSNPDPATLPGGNNNTYNTIYQANYSQSDTEGLSISR